MTRNFRGLVAAEEDKSDDIKLEGPLSNVYFQALNSVYNKDDPNPDHINITLSNHAEGNATDVRAATETQQVDATIANRALQALISKKVTYAAPPAGTTLYGASACDINDGDIVEVVKKSGEKHNFVLVIDYSDPNEEDPTKEIDINDQSELSAVLESMAVRMNIPVFRNLQSALESFSKK